MIIFIYGQDTYRMRKKLKEIIVSYKKIHKSGLSLKYFDCQKKSGEAIFSNFKNEIRQASMFKEKKLTIINSPFSDSDFKEKFLKEAKDFLKSENIILLYEEEKINKNNSLFKFLKKNTKCQEFKVLLGQKLNAWVKKEFEKYDTKIDQDVSETLIEYVGSDLWQMANEIRKLASYKNNSVFASSSARTAADKKTAAGKKQIQVKDVKLLVRSKIETDIFKTIDAIAEKNKKRALELLHKHLEKGDSPLYLLSMINYQFRNLLIVKDFIERCKPYDVILRKSGLHPFVVKKSYYQSQKFSFQELKKIYQKIFQVDINIKTGRIESEMALDLLIAEI